MFNYDAAQKAKAKGGLGWVLGTLGVISLYGVATWMAIGFVNKAIHERANPSPAVSYENSLLTEKLDFPGIQVCLTDPSLKLKAKGCFFVDHNPPKGRKCVKKKGCESHGKDDHHCCDVMTGDQYYCAMEYPNITYTYQLEDGTTEEYNEQQKECLLFNHKLMGENKDFYAASSNTIRSYISIEIEVQNPWEQLTLGDIFGRRLLSTPPEVEHLQRRDQARRAAHEHAARTNAWREERQGKKSDEVQGPKRRLLQTTTTTTTTSTEAPGGGSTTTTMDPFSDEYEYPVSDDGYYDYSAVFGDYEPLVRSGVQIYFFDQTGKRGNTVSMPEPYSGSNTVPTGYYTTIALKRSIAEYPQTNKAKAEDGDPLLEPEVSFQARQYLSVLNLADNPTQKDKIYIDLFYSTLETTINSEAVAYDYINAWADASGVAGFLTGFGMWGGPLLYSFILHWFLPVPKHWKKVTVVDL